MSMYQHRGMGAAPPGSSNRLNDLLNEIRQEFENQSRQTEGFEHQIAAQVSEMQLVREKVYQMEQTHMTLKQKYEEEISMLRHQLEAARKRRSPARGIMAGGSQAGLAPPQQGQQQGQQQQPQGGQQQQPSQQGHAPPQEQQMGPQHQMGQGPPGLPVPPPHPSAQQAPYSQSYPPGPVSNGMAPQPPPEHCLSWSRPTRYRPTS
ncbi:hypothetical protein CEP52_011998 [Fusarium oligoseptatum]|uniref:Transcriptional repressor Tup1 N-terminal domain-containing protein n=1 Tax=Fusarium oligoseptatum TaxID=2604345 RepID=A0A428T0H2_9HYPO|nr:hypothetical protein CEP52_011998 [Fusarium oligoseptatum]